MKTAESIEDEIPRETGRKSPAECVRRRPQVLTMQGCLKRLNMCRVRVPFPHFFPKTRLAVLFAGRRIITPIRAPIAGVTVRRNRLRVKVTPLKLIVRATTFVPNDKTHSYIRLK